MESKKSRLVKGSPEAIEHMKMLRSKRGNKGGGTPAAPAASDSTPTPKQDEIIIEPPPIEQKKTRSRKKITVDFNNV